MASTSPKANTTTTLAMKLLVDTKRQRVLYAEAGKDVVDFLFSLLALPVGAAVELLGKESMAGCVGNVYASVEALDDAYVVQPGAAKDALLHPTTTLSPAAAGAGTGSLLRLPAPPPPDPPSPKKLFRCRSDNCYRGSMFHPSIGTTCRDYMTDTCGFICPTCRGYMNIKVTLLSSEEPAQPSAGAAAGGDSGFVRDVVMDDLKVAPMSTISGITLLNTFGVTDVGMLQERTVQLGYAEGLDILRVSLRSKKVLTDVFLGKKRKA
ncbi:hypothetical protein C2845_PM08G05010 [Panicum miliaceum]|uniref:DUF674 domain-containing protein n=1 Tax=Panicum miliaceum TaxID=4540 RepID=A0A3L6R413_PANMI|nr:hypothetical protein C2845_PM08G05010 [Panicum miliaceum]